MAKEIERKFLVVNDSYKTIACRCKYIKQGYLSRKKEATVRVRISDTDAYLTVKGVNHNATRDEWEYPIPMADAQDMLNHMVEGVVIEKYRYIVKYGEMHWEVDEFIGALAGLVVAEIELEAEDDSFPLPPFIGDEVTGNSAYYNSSLAQMVISEIHDAPV